MHWTQLSEYWTHDTDYMLFYYIIFMVFLSLYGFSLHLAILDLSCLNCVLPVCWHWPFSQFSRERPTVFKHVVQSIKLFLISFNGLYFSQHYRWALLIKILVCTPTFYKESFQVLVKATANNKLHFFMLWTSAGSSWIIVCDISRLSFFHFWHSGFWTQT